jgi:pyridoxal 5'-phosphate synthase pdxS subunit
MKLEELRFGTELIKRGFASMQKGGVIMDVVNAEQAQLAEEAGAVAVMALERVPADIRAAGAWPAWPTRRRSSRSSMRSPSR